MSVPRTKRDQSPGDTRPTARNRLLWVALVALVYWVYKLPHSDHPVGKPARLNVTEVERIFLSVPNPQSAREASRRYAAHPHLAGGNQDFEDAKTMLALFQDEFGIRKPKELPIFEAGTPPSRDATLRLTSRFAPLRPTAWIDTYYPVLNTPLDRSLAILGRDGKVAWAADLEEDGDPLDEEAARYRASVPTWHGLSHNGNATAPFIFVDYGRREEYDELLEKGVNFTGKIVLARYGANFRGLKIKVAQELGAVGALLYSDPRDDGIVTEENGYLPYPQGPARNPTSVQRGTAQFISVYPGDPATPGYPAYKHVERQEGTNKPYIPSLPISWANAQILFKELGDHDSEIRLASLDNLVGRESKRSLQMVNHVDNKITPIWNTMASIPGHLRDEIILIGCHRDAWILGAGDPTSGTASLHEVIRGFGELLRKGWKPLRTIVIASWDAEEYGLVGSTEWGEDFKEWISQHVAAYMNVDISVSGSRYRIGGSPSLAPLIKRTALEIPHPTIANKTLWDARTDDGPYANGSSLAVESNPTVNIHQGRKVPDTGVFALGSGSDYTVFLQHIGVASTDQTFGETYTDAAYHYHSIYDSQRWQEVYADPTFERHVAISKNIGLLSLRIIDHVVLPFNTTQYAFELEDYVDSVNRLAPDDHKPNFSSLLGSISTLQAASLALDAEKQSAEEDFLEVLKRFRHGCGHRYEPKGTLWTLWRYIVDVTHSFAAGDLTNGMLKSPQDVLEFASAIEDQDIHLWPFPIRKLLKAAKRVIRVNKKLMSFERGFISKDGIPDREWYKHLAVAPGKWLGYGSTKLPALAEAITEKKCDRHIKHEIDRLVALVNKLEEVIRP